MTCTHHAGVRGAAVEERNLEPKAIGMGLHWDPPREGGGNPQADLDAMCALYDVQEQVLDGIHPGYTKGADGTLIHTGDSQTGASTWDDERLFNFLNALPANVAKIALMVASCGDRLFYAVRGAVCRLIDHDSDSELPRVDLTARTGRRSHTVAIIRRGLSGWRLAAEESPDLARQHALS